MLRKGCCSIGALSSRHNRRAVSSLFLRHRVPPPSCPCSCRGASGSSRIVAVPAETRSLSTPAPAMERMRRALHLPSSTAAPLVVPSLFPCYRNNNNNERGSGGSALAPFPPLQTSRRNMGTHQSGGNRRGGGKSRGNSGSKRRPAAAGDGGEEGAQQKEEEKKPTATIESRPPEEKDKDSFESKFPLPDREKEEELGALQTQVQELYRAGNYRRGLKVAEELLERTISHFGSAEAAAAASGASGGSSQKKKKKSKKKELEGQDHPAIAAAHNNVGLMQKHLGNFDDSRSRYRSAMKIYARTVGKDHASYASALHNLGTLNRTQIHFDASLTATDRLCLVEESVEYLREAYEVRSGEYGPDHPLTVASRSGWGASLSAQILHYYKRTDGRRYQPVVSGNKLAAAAAGGGWEAAEQHLREALRTAVENPRGPSIRKRQSPQQQQRAKRKKGRAAAAAAAAAMGRPLSTPPQKKAAAGGAGSAAATAEAPEIETLSAASAAQNLAIFLKSRATTLAGPPQTPSEAKGEVGDNDGSDTSSASERPPETRMGEDAGGGEGALGSARADRWNEEAMRLYLDVLKVRTKLLPSDHPDLYATKHSLAELLESVGDEEAANALRQQIVDSYDDGGGSDGSDGSPATASGDAEEGTVVEENSEAAGGTTQK